MHLPTLLLLLLPTLTLSLPSPLPQLPTPPPPPAFLLKSHVLTPPNPSFENLYFSAYPISSPSPTSHPANPTTHYAVLRPLTAQTKPLIGFLNGTTQELADGQGDLLFRFRGGELGFVIETVNSTYNPIELKPGAGTRGMFVGQGVVKYQNPGSGGFYACNKTLRYAPAVQVFYKPKFITTPMGCSDVELVVEGV